LDVLQRDRDLGVLQRDRGLDVQLQYDRDFQGVLQHDPELDVSYRELDNVLDQVHHDLHFFLHQPTNYRNLLQPSSG